MILTRAEILVALEKAGSSSLSESHSVLIDMLHPLVEGLIKDEIGHDIEQANRVEFLPANAIGQSASLLSEVDRGNGVVQLYDKGNTRHGLQLSSTPVLLAGLEVREQVGGYAGQSTDAFPASSLLTLGEDYYLDVEGNASVSYTGILWRNGSWPTEPRSIKVTYTGGHSAPELNGRNGAIKMATMLTFMRAFRQFDKLATNEGSVASRKIGRYSETLDTKSVDEVTGGDLAIPAEASRILSRYKNMSEIM